jgi:hypothetical protein
MNRKIAAVLLTATMVTTPALAAGVASSANTPTATVSPDKAIKAEAGTTKHRHARVSHGHKVHHVKHAKPNQVKHANKISKKSLTSASAKGDTKAVAGAPVKTPIKN